MAKEIKWTKTAQKNFIKTVDYLIENWPDKVVSEFITHTDYTLQLLAIHPDLGILQNREKDIRGILLTPHNKLFYRIAKNQLIVLRIFDTRQNPRKLKFK